MGCGKSDWANELRENQLKREDVAPAFERHRRAVETGAVTAPTQVDATTQMLAARVEGLEKDINGLQFTWGRIKALEATNAEVQGRLERMMQSLQRLEAKRADDGPVPKTQWEDAIMLLRECQDALPVNSFMAHRLCVFLRGVK